MRGSTTSIYARSWRARKPSGVGRSTVRRILRAAGLFDHLRGSLYIDRMETRSFTAIENIGRHWKALPKEAVRAALGLS